MTLDVCVSVCVCVYRVLTELVSKMRDMQMDKTELGCLRAIVLFNPGNEQHVCDWEAGMRRSSGAPASIQACGGVSFPFQ